MTSPVKHNDQITTNDNFEDVTSLSIVHSPQKELDFENNNDSINEQSKPEALLDQI